MYHHGADHTPVPGGDANWAAPLRYVLRLSSRPAAVETRPFVIPLAAAAPVYGWRDVVAGRTSMTTGSCRWGLGPMVRARHHRYYVDAQVTWWLCHERCMRLHDSGGWRFVLSRTASRPQRVRWRDAMLVLAVVALAAPEPLVAASRGGGGSGGGSGARGWHGGGSHQGRSGHRHHHHHGSHTHWSFGFAFGGAWGYPWYPYTVPYYDYPSPAYYPPPIYYVPPPQTVTSSEPDGYWYYCAASKSFYPYVKECADGRWERVEPRAPPPGSDNVRVYTSP